MPYPTARLQTRIVLDNKKKFCNNSRYLGQHHTTSQEGNTMKQRFLFLTLLLFGVIACGGDSQAQQLGIQLSSPIPMHGHSGPSDGGVLRIFATEQSAKNTTAITLMLGEPTNEILNFGMGTAKAGDRVLCISTVRVLKGATAGLTLIQVNNGGGASTAIMHDLTATQHSLYHVANNHESVRIVAIMKINSTGSLIPRLSGISQGSDATIAINDAQLYCLFLVKN